jgi:hypothetical protein
MRVLTLATLVSLLPAALAAGEPSTRARRAADDLTEMRAAIATLVAIVDAASRPAAPDEDAPRLLEESLRKGSADPAAMGAIVRWVLREKEEKIAATFADALDHVDPRLQGVEGERWSAAARSVLAVFQGVLRDAEHHRRRDGDALLRELKPAIDAAADALKHAQAKGTDEPAPEKAIPDETVPVPNP